MSGPTSGLTGWLLSMTQNLNDATAAASSTAGAVAAFVPVADKVATVATDTLVDGSQYVKDATKRDAVIGATVGAALGGPLGALAGGAAGMKLGYDSVTYGQRELRRTMQVFTGILSIPKNKDAGKVSE